MEFDQCEVTYVNHIRTCSVWRSHKDLAKVFRGWSKEYESSILPNAESISVRTRQLINDASGKFLGRLHVELDSAFLESDASQPSDELAAAFMLQLVARGLPIGSGVAGLIEFLNLGRAEIVSAFDRMTTPEMHEEWGKEL